MDEVVPSRLPASNIWQKYVFRGFHAMLTSGFRRSTCPCGQGSSVFVVKSTVCRVRSIREYLGIDTWRCTVSLLFVYVTNVTQCVQPM